VRRFLRALKLIAHGFRGETITLRASALTYLTLLALVPLLAVIFSVVDLFTGEAQIHDKLQTYVNQQLGIGAGAAISNSLAMFTSKATIQTLGAIGFFALLFSVISLLWNIESAFNHIYAVRTPRGLLERLLKYWSFLTLGPILLAGSIYITYSLSHMTHAHGQPGHSELLHALATLSSIAITYAGLIFLYKVVPNAKVRFRSAVVAAFSAGTAWEIAKFLFAWASGRMVQVHKIYGSLAVLPITLTWIYISWSIALVGCRLCYALDASRKPEPNPALMAAMARETFTARLMVALMQLHLKGRGPVSVRVLTREIEATPRMVREGLTSLVSEGLAVETKNGRWLPAKDAAHITLAQLRHAGRRSLPFPVQHPDPVGHALGRSLAQAEAAAESALGETLESFLKRSSEAVSDPEPLAPAMEEPAQKPA
jgi:membrane protein